jgi:hypothetical protein
MDLGEVGFLNNLLNSNSKKSSSSQVIQNTKLERILTTRLSRLLDKEPTLAYFILEKLDWNVDHAARRQILQIVKDVSQSAQTEAERHVIINNNAAIVAHTHERFLKLFQEDATLVELFPFTKRRNIEILAYSIDQYCDLSSYQDYEIGYKSITTVAWSDSRMRNQRDMLINEGYDVDITSLTIEDYDTKIQYYHTWLFNNRRNGNRIIQKVSIEDLLKFEADDANIETAQSK